MEPNFESNKNRGSDFDSGENPEELLEQLSEKIEVLIDSKKDLEVENFNLKEKLKDWKLIKPA